MADVADYLNNRPYGLNCDAIAGLGIDVENVAEGLVDLINSLTLNPTSAYPGQVDARLTLESGVPVSTTDQSAKNTLYYTPFAGDVVPLYDTTQADFVDRYLTSEISQSLLGLSANSVHDVFANWNGSSIVLSTEQWATPTTRNIPLTTARGVKVKSGALTHRHVGTLRVNATGGQCEDTLLQRFLWNRDNRKRRDMLIQIDATTWTATANVWTASNGDPTLRVECVIGEDEDTLEGTFTMNIFNSTIQAIAVGIGLDKTNGNDAQLFGAFASATAVTNGQVPPATYKGHPGIGYHYFQCVERAAGSGTATFGGTYGVPTRIQAGLSMSIFN